MNSSMIPQQDWSRPNYDAFTEAAGLTNSAPSQKMLCLVCSKQGNRVPPTAIVMVDGTSLCAEHI